MYDIHSFDSGSFCDTDMKIILMKNTDRQWKQVDR